MSRYGVVNAGGPKAWIATKFEKSRPGKGVYLSAQRLATMTTKKAAVKAALTHARQNEANKETTTRTGRGSFGGSREKNGSWITMNGHHVFIQDGE